MGVWLVADLSCLLRQPYQSDPCASKPTAVPYASVGDERILLGSWRSIEVPIAIVALVGNLTIVAVVTFLRSHFRISIINDLTNTQIRKPIK